MNNLRKIRKKKGLTQQELADMVGVSRQLICYMEKGKYNITNSIIKKMSKALEISPVEIMGVDNFKFMPKTEEEKEYVIKIVKEGK